MVTEINQRFTANGAVYKIIISFTLSAVIFAVIYAQSPLYTSNQNQYFLHGLAQAGFGLLQEDWLASTVDPTPIFSFLVYGTYKLVNSGIPFYFYYAILLGIYLYSLIGIVNEIYKEWSSRTKLLFFASFLLIHSAALRYLIARAVGAEWTFILEGGLANQRVLGQVFQPSAFGVLLILAINLFIKYKTLPAIFACTLAASIHPTYLLSAALLVIAFIITTYLDDKDINKTIKMGFFALMSILPILVYVLFSFQSDLSPRVAEAREILIHYRLPHHALISEWFDFTTVVQIILVLSGIILTTHTRLTRVLWVVLILTAGLFLLQWATDNPFLALVFPWRISVILVPVSTTIVLAKILNYLSVKYKSLLERGDNVVRFLSFGLIAILCLAGGSRFVLELGGQPVASEQNLYSFISETKEQSQVSLIPIKLQDFRLASGAPAYVDFKSIPYASGDVLEWFRRIGVAEKFYKGGIGSCKSLEQLVGQEGVNQVVLEKSGMSFDCHGWKLVYEDEFYQVIKFENKTPKFDYNYSYSMVSVLVPFLRN